MTITQKISRHIRCAKEHDGKVDISDYQVRVVEKGAVLVNLKTSEAELIKADQSDDNLTADSLAQ